MRRRLKILLGVLLALLAIGAVLWLAIVPWYVRKRIIEEANARGVQLQLGDLSIGFSSATVRGVTATAQKVPGVTVTAGRVDVTLRRFQPESVSIANASVDIDGRAGDIATAVDTFLGTQPKGDGEGVAPAISMQNARIEWRRALGDNTALHVGDLGGDVKGNPLGDDVNVHLAGITLDVGAANMGPWSGTLVRNKEKSDVTLSLSPKGPEVGQLHVTRPIGSRSFTVYAKVSALVSLVDLGFSKTILSLVNLEDAAISIDATHTEDKATGTGHGVVHELRLRGFRLSRAQAATVLDLADVAYAGTLEKMTIDKGRVRVGPLSGPVDGAIARPEGAVRIYAHTKTDVMTCGDALKRQSNELLGSQATGFIDDLAGTLGLERHVAGTVTAEAQWSFDTRDLAGTTLKVVPTATCDLSFLPR